MTTTVSPSVSEDLLRIGSLSFRSRLILGTGKYSSPEIMAAALEASGAELITVAVRRVDLKAPDKDPNRAEYHFRLGQTMLGRAEDPSTADDALEQFRLDVKNNPNHTSAAFQGGALGPRATRCRAGTISMPRPRPRLLSPPRDGRAGH